MTSVMRSRVPCSRPLVRLTTGTHARRWSSLLRQRGAEPVRRHAHHEHVGVADDGGEVGVGTELGMEV